MDFRLGAPHKNSLALLLALRLPLRARSLACGDLLRRHQAGGDLKIVDRQADCPARPTAQTTYRPARNPSARHRPWRTGCRDCSAPGVALVGGEAKPFGGLGVVARHAVAVVVQNAETVLRVGVALRRGEAIPFRRLPIVAGNAMAVVVEDAEIVLRRGKPLLGGAAIPLRARRRSSASRRGRSRTSGRHCSAPGRRLAPRPGDTTSRPRRFCRANRRGRRARTAPAPCPDPPPFAASAPRRRRSSARLRRRDTCRRARLPPTSSPCSAALRIHCAACA